MKKIKLLFFAIITLSVCAFTVIKVVNWKVKDNYSIKYDSTTFSGLKASISFDQANPENSKILATIEAKTINTGKSLKDEHAREALETDKFPLITFESTAVSLTTVGYEVTGNLMIKGIVKSIKFPFTFDKQTFSGAFTIVPSEFNVTRMGTPKEVTIQLTIPVEE